MSDRKNMNHLKGAVNAYYMQGFDLSLSRLLELQRELQAVIQDTKGDQMPVEIWRQDNLFTDEEADRLTQCNMMAIEDEIAEMRDAVNWKWWKPKNYNMPLDRFNIAMEAVDILHFLLNIFNTLGFDGKDVVAMYLAKRDENMARQRGEGPHGKEYVTEADCS